jgi:hypothetical protein
LGRWACPPTLTAEHQSPNLIRVLKFVGGGYDPI